jgi:hypothetical protein
VPLRLQADELYGRWRDAFAPHAVGVDRFVELVYYVKLHRSIAPKQHHDCHTK